MLVRWDRRSTATPSSDLIARRIGKSGAVFMVMVEKGMGIDFSFWHCEWSVDQIESESVGTDLCLQKPQLDISSTDSHDENISILVTPKIFHHHWPPGRQPP